MTQIGDMFNSELKERVSKLCGELSDQLKNLTRLPSGNSNSEPSAGEPKPAWPASWGSPSSAGGQNGVKYAFFPAARRLTVEDNGKKTVYDTGEHHINGVSQQQGLQSRLAFSTVDGPVDVSALKVVTDAEG